MQHGTIQQPAVANPRSKASQRRCSTSGSSGLAPGRRHPRVPPGFGCRTARPAGRQIRHPRMLTHINPWHAPLGPTCFQPSLLKLRGPNTPPGTQPAHRTAFSHLCQHILLEPRLHALHSLPVDARVLQVAKRALRLPHHKRLAVDVAAHMGSQARWAERVLETTAGRLTPQRMAPSSGSEKVTASKAAQVQASTASPPHTYTAATMQAHQASSLT